MVSLQLAKEQQQNLVSDGGVYKHRPGPARQGQMVIPAKCLENFVFLFRTRRVVYALIPTESMLLRCWRSRHVDVSMTRAESI